MRLYRDCALFVPVPLLAAALVLACSLVCADARLGETRERISGQGGRYGEAIGETTRILKESQETVDTFRKDDIDITAEYNRKDEVWRITFQKKDLTQKFIDQLLKINGGDQEWSKPVTYRKNKHWVSADRSIHAVYYGNPIYKLVIMTRDALEAEREPQSLEGRTTTEVGEAKEEEEEEADPKKVKGILDGF